MNLHKFAFTFFIILSLFSSLQAQEPAPVNSGELQLALDKMNTLGTVLYIAAHPDDENTRLLSYLANERKFRTIYLSLTRGDGGQNLIGKEQGSELGMIRTRELLAARNVDRAEQYFTRANDFGFSKNPEETFTIWPREEILSDVVWAIRYFKPDVIINRFPTTGEGGHGHHTASAMLSLEAFKAAADPLRFPDQLKDVEVWQAKRVFLNSFVPRGQVQPEYDGQLKMDVGGYNPLLGISYGEIAAKSRSMHKSQGFGVPRGRGTQIEYFRKQAGDTVVTEIFEGVDSTWKRVKGSDEIEKIFQQASTSFDAHHPEKVIPLLVQALKKLKSLENSYWKNYKIKELEKLIAACAGLWFEVNPKDFYATPGDSMEFTVTGISRLLTGLKFNKISFAGFDSTLSKEFIKNEPFSLQKKMVIPLNTNYTNPFWLRQQHDPGLYNIKDLTVRGEPWNTDGLKAVFQFTIGGEEISYSAPISYKWTDPVKGELYRMFEITPPVSITPLNEVIIFTDPHAKKFQLKIKSYSDSLIGKIGYSLPSGYMIQAVKEDFNLKGKGSDEIFEFSIQNTNVGKEKSLQNSVLKMWVEVNGKKYDLAAHRIEYDHIPPMLDLKVCEIKLVPVQMKSIVKKIGYIEGAGDEVAKCLKQAGFEVDVLTENEILNNPLSQYGTIITGIRAYNTLENINRYHTPLMKFVEEGGNLIVQYNTSNFLSSVKSEIGPFPFKIGRDRVTVESAPVHFDKPDHSILNHPNKITEADFEHWVQERGLYFATDLAPEYETVLSWNDPGEKPLNGGLIMAKKGKGTFIYTGISFFRQLPAGVPGAYRLMSNLINTGK